mgnify:CR=1 FL=1
MPNLRLIEGACHCRNIRFTVGLPAAETLIRVRACSCAFCIKHGGVYTSHPSAELDIHITDPSLVEHYQFGTKTADFLICRRCGVVPVVTSVINDHCYAVVNVNTFENIDRAEFDYATTDFEAEATDDRLARRQQNWIAQVKLMPAGQRPA